MTVIIMINDHCDKRERKRREKEEMMEKGYFGIHPKTDFSSFKTRK